jgi:hypothetical protein
MLECKGERVATADDVNTTNLMECGRTRRGSARRGMERAAAWNAQRHGTRSGMERAAAWNAQRHAMCAVPRAKLAGGVQRRARVRCSPKPTGTH